MAVKNLGINMDDALAKRSYGTTGADMMRYLMELMDVLDDKERFIEIYNKVLDYMHEFSVMVDETCRNDCEVAIMFIAMEQTCMLTFIGMDERMKLAYELDKMGFDMFDDEEDDAVGE